MRDDNLSLTKELRVYLDDAEHAMFDMVAKACGETMQSITRRLVRDFLDAKRHEATVIARYLESERIATESRRNGGA